MAVVAIGKDGHSGVEQAVESAHGFGHGFDTGLAVGVGGLQGGGVRGESYRWGGEVSGGVGMNG